MSLYSAMHISLGGMSAQVQKLNYVAGDIAHVTAGHNEDGDIASNLIDMDMSEHFFKANFCVFQVTDEVLAQIIDLKR